MDAFEIIGRARAQVLDGRELTREQALELLRLPADAIPYLAAAGNEVRLHFNGRKVEACALVNARSGACSEDCAFCSQSAHYSGTTAPVYPMLGVEEIVRQAKEAEARGADEFCIVTSGRDPGDGFDALVEAVRAVATNTRLRPGCSVGFLTDEQAAILHRAGLVRNNHNLEAAPSHFGKVVTTHTFQDRVDHVRRMRAAGLQPCCGGIIGMGESPAQRLELAFALRDLQPSCVTLNVLDPRPGTPMSGHNRLDPMEIIRTVALFRLIIPKGTLKLAGGREVNLRDLQAIALMAGANGLILGNYLTTRGRDSNQDLQMLRDLGFETCEPAAGPA